MKIFVFFTYVIALVSVNICESANLDANKKDVWEDLRIQKLLPNYLVVPAIEPFLPENYIASDSDPFSPIYWGPKDVVEEFLKAPEKGPKAPIFVVQISVNVGQKDENSFTNEEISLKSLQHEFKKIEDYKFEKIKWGKHPIQHLSTKIDGERLNSAWIGLNYESNVLFVHLLCPEKSTENDLKIWTDFIEKTRPLNTYETYKAKRQDMREGYTLLNEYGSLVKISAERRKKDQKIQVVIKPYDELVHVKCEEAISQCMLGDWHKNDPVVVVKATIQKTGEFNILDDTAFAVLLKDVSEFTKIEDNSNQENLINCQFGNIDILNYCAKKVME